MVDGVEVQAIAAFGPRRRAVAWTGAVTTTEHAELLRDLSVWSTFLATSIKVTELEVREDLKESGQLTARLVVATRVDAVRVGEIVMPIGSDGWSTLVGVG
ncbi:hypothetical protein [Streptosporangium sp. CA-115845]|uniref:hypothetical protein n=1 Tax=Streptosporangium sp. CA-115845 TaxID=3240071 RepID=UPI003D8B3173